MKFGFIGGTSRGFLLFQALLSEKLRPAFCFILKEDEHENTKTSTSFKVLADKNNITNAIKKKLQNEDYEMIKNGTLDFIIVCGWRTLIDPEINKYLKAGLIAAHDSLLPAYRGFAPLNWAIINGELKTGVTLFIINDGEVDSGEIILQKEIDITHEDYAIDVYTKVVSATIEGYKEVIYNYIKNGKIETYKQNEKLATYTCKRTPEDGQIVWGKSSIEVYNLIRALAYPYAGAFFYFKNNKYEVRSACIGPQNSKIFTGNIPGKVISVLQDGVEILCKEGTVVIKEIVDCNTNVIINSNQLLKSITIKL